MSISPVDFNYLRILMRDQTAIVIDPGKEYLAESRLAGLIHEEGFPTIRDLVQELRSKAFNGLHRKVINAMTNNETWFFRDLVPFQAMRKTILPALMTARKTEQTLRIWSAACSSGQEPYSIAMCIREEFPELRGWRLQIMATDVDSAILQRAEAGLYKQLEVNRGLPVALLSRYFDRVGADWKVAPDIRNNVEFKLLNLVERWPSFPSMDIIFIRNVLIYFDIEVRKAILGEICRQLRPDGFMLLGAAETTMNLTDQFERVQYESTAYYRLKHKDRA